MVEQKASELHASGYNCAQAVLAACGDYTRIPLNEALAIAGGFGGGLRCGEVCGAVSGALMAIGMCVPYSDCKDLKAKDKIASLAVRLCDEFKAKFEMLRCEDIKGKDFTCDDFIKYAAELAEKIIKENQY